MKSTLKGNGDTSRINCQTGSLFTYIIDELNRRSKVTGPDTNGNYITFCPYHIDVKTPNLSVHPDKGFHCFACGEKGSLNKLAEKLGIEIPTQKLTADEAIIKLIQERHLTQATIIHFGIKANIEKQAYEYPIDGGSRYKAFQKESKHKYWHDQGIKNQLYNLESVPDGTTEIWYVNGEPAVWQCWQAGVPATCGIYGEGRLPEGTTNQLKVKGIKIINVCLDLDETGAKGAERIRDKLKGNFTVHVRKLPEELGKGGDIGDLFIRAGKDFVKKLNTLPVIAEKKKLPRIDIDEDKRLRDITEESLKALYASNDPVVVFQRGGILCRIIIDEWRNPIIEELSGAAFRGILERSANFFRLSNKRDELVEKPIAPPSMVVDDCLSLNNWDFPPLISIVETPVLKPDGSALTTPGYDVDTCLYYFPARDLVLPAIPDNPTEDDLSSAIGLILEPLHDFPFDSQASRANMIATMITPILRPLIKGPIPMALFDKPQPGTGASLLANIISLIITGKDASMAAAPKDDESWRKSITSILMKGPLITIIDNIEGILSSASLGALLTATQWSDRILGKNQWVSLSNYGIWIGTGNNIQLAGDLPRRCIWIRVDAEMPRPWLRDNKEFKHPAVEKWVVENRGRILAAMLTIAKGWVKSGKQEWQGQYLGKFEEWCKIVGGVISYMGIEGFLENLELMYDKMDQETLKWEMFLEIWHHEIGEEAITAARLASIIKDNENLGNSLPDSLPSPNDKGFTRTLGRALARRDCIKYSNGFTIKRAGEEKHAVKWQVLPFQKKKLTQNSYKSEFSELPHSNPAVLDKEEKFSFSAGEMVVTENSLNSLPATERVSFSNQRSPGEINEGSQEDELSCD